MTELPKNNALVSDIVCEFLEVAIHNILYIRKLYPDAIFEPRRKYGVIVYYSRHPGLNDYIIQCLKAAVFHLKRNQLRGLFVCFEVDGQLVEKYSFDIHEICDGFEGDPFLLKLEQTLRDFYLTLQSSTNCLQSLSSDAKFSLQLKVTEHSNVELNQDPSFERPKRRGRRIKLTDEQLYLVCEWDSCALDFSEYDSFEKHLKIHLDNVLEAGVQSYLCSQCSKYFASERLLKYHMRTHINHYKCSMCEMTCPKPSILAKHIRFRHVKEKPYKCPECNYRCVAKHNLDFHMKTHNRENEYKCPDCDFECRSAFGLDIHTVKKHGKGWHNVYECHNCRKRFIRGGLLTKHLMKVHNYVWPSGHSRFRYKEEHDGVFRLQTVRYETLDVTQEIIKAKPVKQPSAQKSMKFEILKKPDTANFIPTFDVVIGEERGRSKSKPKKEVLITIDDIDLKGNVVKSQTIHSSEIICSDENEMNGTDIKNCIVVKDEAEA